VLGDGDAGHGAEQAGDARLAVGAELVLRHVDVFGDVNAYRAELGGVRAAVQSGEPRQPVVAETGVAVRQCGEAALEDRGAGTGEHHVVRLETGIFEVEHSTARGRRSLCRVT
jgi:hypothetical protein